MAWPICSTTFHTRVTGPSFIRPSTPSPSLPALLPVIACATYPNPLRRPWPTALVLGLLALPHIYGLMLATGFAILIIWRLAASPSSLRRSVAPSLFLLAAMFGFSVLQMRPHP